MISSTDIPARLRLLRYGLITLVVTTFLVSLFAPYVYLSPLSNGGVSITTFLNTALLFTGVVAVLSVIIYFAYRAILQRSVK